MSKTGINSALQCLVTKNPQAKLEFVADIMPLFRQNHNFAIFTEK